VFLNTTQRGDGQWRSLHNDGFFKNSKLLGLVYQNALAREVQKLGYAVDVKPGGTIELQGYSKEQLESFSKRTLSIKSLNCVSKKQERIEKLKSRAKKGNAISREDLKYKWMEEAKQIGLQHPKLGESFTRELTRKSLQEAVQEGICHASQREVVFRKEAVEKFALESKLGQVSFAELEREIKAAVSLETLRSNHKDGLVAKSELKIEKNILDLLRFGQGTRLPIASDPAGLETCSTEQKNVIKSLLSSVDSVHLWQGVAGAGKTFALAKVRDEAKSKGFEIVGLAPSAEAAFVLESEAGIKSQTVASFLMQKESWNLQDQNQKSLVQTQKIIIVDEASLLSNQDCLSLLEKCKDKRVLFVGDTRQLGAVDAGNPFLLMQRNNVSASILKESRRQKNETLKNCVAMLNQGKIKEGVELISKDVVEIKEPQKRRETLVKEFLTLTPQNREKSLILAGTKLEREKITQLLRDQMKLEGNLTQQTTITVLEQKDLTRSQLKQSHFFEIGDEILPKKQLGQSAESIGKTLTLVGKDKNMLLVQNQKGNILKIDPLRTKIETVFSKKELEIANGEKIQFTRNDRSVGVRYGQMAIVASTTTQEINLVIQDGKKATTKKLNKDELLHLRHGYVQTVHSSQGKTCDNVFLCSENNMSQAAFYVGVTRAREQVRIFVEDKSHFELKATRESQKIIAKESVAQEFSNSNKVNVTEVKKVERKMKL
jgi:ATP-dependent exoDNAse (exonuclease V) alpha subunit